MKNLHENTFDKFLLEKKDGKERRVKKDEVIPSGVPHPDDVKDMKSIWFSDKDKAKKALSKHKKSKGPFATAPDGYEIYIWK